MNTSSANPSVEKAYSLAQERHAALGVDTGQALERLAQVSLSLHCWQGDDLGGFETSGGELGGGLAATGNYPGKARNAGELRRDLESQSIQVRAGSLPGLAEEAPTAYKDVEVVVETVVAVGIARKVAHLKPVAVIKG